MAIFTKSTVAQGLTLRNHLENKGDELRQRQDAEAIAAENLSRAAAQAQVNSDTAAAHALAVEQALTILDEAGVVL